MIRGTWPGPVLATGSGAWDLGPDRDPEQEAARARNAATHARIMADPERHEARLAAKRRRYAAAKQQKESPS